MPNRQYQKGYRLENAVVNHLKALGYVAERAYGSKGKYGEDVTAWVEGWEDGVIYLIQCKADGKRAGMMRPEEWNRFLGRVTDLNGDSPTMNRYAVILANGTPSHIKFWRITGPRKEGLSGHSAKKDIEANLEEYRFVSVDEIAIKTGNFLEKKS